jgi:SAM-dependent methyltransferase
VRLRSDTCNCNGYSDAELALLPAEAVAVGLGCGNPTALASLQPGEVVLDLGSGGGIDVLLASQRVGPSGHVYGVDTTPAMIDLARRNAARAGATNVEFTPRRPGGPSAAGQVGRCDHLQLRRQPDTGQGSGAA